MMSLDSESVLPHKLSPSFPATVRLPEQPQLAKSRPLHSKNALQLHRKTKLPVNPAAPPTQRVAKRRYSMGAGLKAQAKRRRRTNSDSQSEPSLPSHFLMGGNIFDPLNLNSLLDEDVNKATNQETPQSSPLPSRGGDPVEILFPRDITDPLNLKGGNEDGRGGDGVLLSPLKSRKRHRHRHHGGVGDRDVMQARLFPSTAALTVPSLTTEGSVPASPLPCELNTAITCREDIAPPPILPRRHTHPPPGQKTGSQRDGRQRRRRRTTSVRSAETTRSATQPTKFQTPLIGGAKDSRCGGQHPCAGRRRQRSKDKHRYQYGNHNRYYGYQGFYGDKWEGWVGAEEDHRLSFLDADWFRDKKVLDIGSGTGHVALAIARRFEPTHILGVELDEQLVRAARQNIRHFLSHDFVVKERRGSNGVEVKDEDRIEEQQKQEEGVVVVEEEVVKEDAMLQELQRTLLSLPMSFRVSRGPLCAPPLLLSSSSSSSSSSSRFPSNITFIQGNYVTPQEQWPGQGRYDVVMCLGVTKWVQLQSGDAGVVRLFRRAYRSLSPGGLFILEPQPWRRYSHSKRASEATYRHYRTIRLRPEKFTSYLTNSVGFSSYRMLTHTGNHRPIYMFHKGPAQKK
ncbi:7SK snRNA methylphosphate capping enzyme-like [Nelusetta ayraudi]|uniref:7SK snRNA methylphosphate capping enzyme-like n=1 Tax=Nelusetta ayraudi TaxID=303726 RepID=UPI003F71C859